MIYTVIVDGRSYDLPKKTLAVMQSIEDVTAANKSTMPIREKAKKNLAFITGLIGSENAEAALGTLMIEDIDMTELSLMLQKIIDAYNKPLEEYTTNAQLEKINQLPLDKLGKLSELAKQK